MFSVYCGCGSVLDVKSHVFLKSEKNVKYCSRTLLSVAHWSGGRSLSASIALSLLLSLLVIERGVMYEFRLAAKNNVDLGDQASASLITTDGRESSTTSDVTATT